MIKMQKTFTKDQREIMYQVYNDAKKFHSRATMDSESFPAIEIINCGRLKTTAGKAMTNRATNSGIIKVNKRLFQTTGTLDNFKNTFSHELAHILANIIYGVNCGHDHRWKTVHKALGGTGERCHTMEVNHLRPKLKRVVYSCACVSHRLTTAQHNRIQQGRSKFTCKQCNEELRYGND